MKAGWITLFAAAATGIAVVASAEEPAPVTPASSAGADISTSALHGNVPMSRLVTTFTTFAGSTANAESLVEGLRTGSTITLVNVSDNTQTSFSPPTKPMGWGNVKIALALAQAELTRAGITNPTPADIEAALNGGTVVHGTTNTTFTGVLVQRADGMGWGQIARADNLNLGKVVSAVSKPTPGMKPLVASHGGVARGNVSASGTSQARLHGHGIVSAGGTVAQQTKSTRGVVSAAGSAGNGAMQHGTASGVVSAAGPVSPVTSTTQRAAVAMTTAAGGESVGGGVVTAAGAGASPHGNPGHGKGHGG